MKIFFTLIFLFAANQHAMALSPENNSTEIMDAIDSAVDASTTSQELNWKVGDTTEFQVSAGFFGSGTMTKVVTQDTGTAFWVKQDMQIPTHQEQIEKLYNKANGEVLKVIRNGSEQNPEDSKLEIISQEDASVTVPAGTFRALHIVGKTKKTSKLEMWLNPTETAIDGTVKLIISSSFYTITSELSKIKKAQ